LVEVEGIEPELTFERSGELDGEGELWKQPGRAEDVD